MSKTKKFSSLAEYLETQPKRTKEVLKELRSCILAAVPHAAETFFYNVPAFVLKEGKKVHPLMIAGFKKHVGFYPLPVVIEKFKEDLQEYKIGRGSVQFPLDQPLPKELITRMIKYRMELLLN